MMDACVFALAGVTALASAGSAQAQGIDEAALALHANLKAGDRVTLSLTDRVVKGKLLVIAPDALLVQTDAGDARVSFEAVHEARRK